MKLVIEIDDQIKNVQESIKVTKQNHGIIEGIYKMTVQEFIDCLNNATNDDAEDDMLETPVLPRNCIKFVWKNLKHQTAEVYIEVAKNQFDIHYYDNFLEQVGFPRMIFKYSLDKNKVKLSKIFAVKDDGRPITHDTPLYNFPFSHVSSSGGVCMGGNIFPDIQRMQQLETYHMLFIGSPFSNDYGAKTLSNYPLGQLFDHLVKKQFNDEWLLPYCNVTKEIISFGEYLNFKTI